MNGVKNLLRGNVRQYGMLVALVVIIVFFQFTTDGTMLNVSVDVTGVSSRRR